MRAFRATVTSLFLVGATAQTTYTGCYMEGSVSHCFNSNGVELAMTTLTAITSPSTPASVSATTTSRAQTTAITDCHLHATNIFCVDGEGEEVQVQVTGTPTQEPPAEYTDCHSHGSARYCVDPNGNDLAILTAEAHSDDGHDTSTSEGGMDCHFHAGVE
jgi:zinc transporter 1/2/3